MWPFATKSKRSLQESQTLSGRAKKIARTIRRKLSARRSKSSSTKSIESPNDNTEHPNVQPSRGDMVFTTDSSHIQEPLITADPLAASSPQFSQPSPSCETRSEVLVSGPSSVTFATVTAQSTDQDGNEVATEPGDGSEGEPVAKESATDRTDEFDRRDFKTIHSIQNDVIEKVVFGLINPEQKDKVEHVRKYCAVTYRTEGSFNHVAMVVCYNWKQGDPERYALKIPAHSSRWTAEDSYMHRAEVLITKHMYNDTEVPVPNIVSWSDSTDNELGAPYILMKKLTGTAASHLWRGTDDSAEENKKKRITFLRSLASVMAELRDVTCEGIGLPQIDDWNNDPVTVGHSYQWHDKRAFFAVTRREPFASSEEFFKARIPDLVRNLYPDEGDDDYVRLFKLGFEKVLNIIFSTSAFTTSKGSPTDEAESFVFRHDDLDFQNILTDDDGNVTGIIDLGGVSAVPRCVGYLSTPLFLFRPWLSGFEFDHFPCTTWENEEYRNVYADACLETGCSDARYTRKSHIYQAGMLALHESYSVEDFVAKVLFLLPGFEHCELEGFFVALGRGWPDAELYLQKEITKLLEPDSLPVPAVST